MTLNEAMTITPLGVEYEVPGNALCTLTDPSSFSSSGVPNFQRSIN